MLTVYSKNNCHYCTRAKNLLSLRQIAFEERNIDHDDAAKEFILSQGHRTLPQIYLGEKLFVEGGFEGLSRLNQDEIDFRLGKTNLGTL